MIKPLKFKSENLLTDGKCNGCTDCCTVALTLTRKEFYKLKDKITKEIINKYEKEMKQGIYNLKCPFVTNNGCSIYDERPRICKEYLCDNDMETLARMAKDIKYMKEEKILLYKAFPKKIARIIEEYLLYKEVSEKKIKLEV